MRKLLIATLLTVATTAHAASTASLNGTLATVSTATASDSILVDRSMALVIGIGGTLGTTAAQCQTSHDGTTWANIGSSVSALGIVCTVTNPVGFYRVNVTTCTGCSLTVSYRTTRNF